MTMKDLPVMPVYTIDGDSVTTVVNPAGSPFTDTQAVPLKDTETVYTFPLGAKRFMLKLDKGALTYGYSTGSLNFKIAKNAGLEIENIDPSKQITLYYKSDSDNDTLRIDYWL